MDSLRLEVVTTCVGFDDLLDFTISFNHQHFDTYIVVTSHDDKKTKAVCHKHNCICVQTDLFKKNGRNFNKGAAINAGFGHFQYWGWRLHLDSDIVLPDKFRQTLFNHTHLERDCLYGADRIDVVGKGNINKLRELFVNHPQHRYSSVIGSTHNRRLTCQIADRVVFPLEGYVPIGFFQLWNAETQRPYPYSLGTAAHDDVLFAGSYPQAKRRHLPTVITYHICPRSPKFGDNWDGHRRMPRLNKDEN